MSKLEEKISVTLRVTDWAMIQNAMMAYDLSGTQKELLKTMVDQKHDIIQELDVVLDDVYPIAKERDH